MKHIYRTHKDRILSGVCGGFAEYFSVDPSLVRLVWIFFTLFGGSGIFAYILAIVIIPDEYERPRENRNQMSILKNDKTILWGALLVFVGLILFFQHNELLRMVWSRFWDSGINLLLAMSILGFGLYLLYSKRNDISAMINGGTGLPLHLSERDRKIAGVCGGIAESLNVDGVFIRFIWIYATVMSAGIGILLYLVLALILPSESLKQTD